MTLDAELRVKHERALDLLTSIEAGLRERRMGSAVRLQCEAGLPTDVRAALIDELELAPDDLYESEGFTAFSDLFQLYAALDLPRLKDQRAHVSTRHAHHIRDPRNRPSNPVRARRQLVT